MLIDLEVLQRARAGDDAAFTEIVSTYKKRILGTIGRLIGKPEDVEDVAQEAFTRLYFSFDQLRTPDVFEPWLFRLTVNASYDYLRKQRRRPESRMADLSEQQVVLADASVSGRKSLEEARRTQARDQVEAMFAKVSEEDRILLTLREVEGLSVKELQDVYRVGESVMKVRLFRARQRMLKAYEKTQAKKG